MKEKWNAPPLYSDEEFAAEKAKASDAEMSGTASAQPAQ